MMDIADKLRSQIGDDPKLVFDRDSLLREAADEIDQLRATPTGSDVHLRITIGPRSSTAERLSGLAVFIAATLAIPVVNETVLSGHWAIHIIGGFVGMLAVTATWVNTLPTTRRFATKEAAAAWVRGGEWERRA